MNKKAISLLIPEKADPEFDSVLEALQAADGEIIRLGKYWVFDEHICQKKLAVYGSQSFALILAQLYHLELISPDDRLLAAIPTIWTKRKIEAIDLTTAKAGNFPCFIKPQVPKLFQAAVFNTNGDFEDCVLGLSDNEAVLRSEIIADIAGEVRSFVLNGQILDLAFYEGEGNLAEARDFLSAFLADNAHLLPFTLVVDLAYSPSLGWMVLEFNAAWGAGLNNCRAALVLEAILAATQQQLPSSVHIFDKYSDFYRERYWSVAQYAEGLDFLCHSAKEQATVLELACGPGNVTRYLLDKRPDFQILATDLSPKMLALAKAANPEIQVQMLDCRYPASLNRHFDILLCGFGLPYISREAAVSIIEQASEILNEGGLLYISAIEGDYSKSGMQRSSKGDECMMYFHERAPLLAAIEKAGFRLLIQDKNTNAITNDAEMILIAQK